VQLCNSKLSRSSFLEGWERNPVAFLSHPESDDSDPDAYQDLPEGSGSESSDSGWLRKATGLRSHPSRKEMRFKDIAMAL
jgi:hypothetical protein